MNDMTTVIQPKSDQINADDLIGRNMTITIRDVQIRGGQEQPVSIYFEGSDKAFRPCKSMSRVLVNVWGPDAKKYIGRSLTLYRDPSVKWGGLEVGGIRISHMSDIENSMTMALTATKGSRKPFVVKPLTIAAPAAPEDKAAAWTEGFIGAVQAIADAATLEALIAKNKKTLDRLKAERPELASKTDFAIETMRTGFSDPFAGRSDDDMGEGFAIDADQLIAFINSKARQEDVISLFDSHQDSIAGFDADDIGRVEAARDARIALIKGA